MDIVTWCLCGGLALTLTLVIAIHRRLDALPPRIWSIAKQDRAQDERAAVTALQEATAARVGPAVSSLVSYHEQIAATFRAQVADAQMRARIAERQSSDAGVALRAASELVREARALREDLAELLLASAPAEPHVAPELPPEPGLIAAGLGPRPNARPAPPATTAHPTASGSRKLTMVGLGQAPDADSEDSGAWTHETRPSDADGEHTRVGPRPSPQQLGLGVPPHAAPTMVSMQAVSAPSSRPVPPVEFEIRPKKTEAP